MAAGHGFMLDLVTVLGAAAVGGLAANRLKQPVLLGYLVSGLVIGPFGLKLLQDTALIKSLAEVGVAFLLFALGVEFSLKELNRVRGIALGGGFLQLGITTVLVGIVAVTTGWVAGINQGIFLGALLSLSSTAVILKTLTERGEVQTLHGQVMLAILIVQDLALGLMLAILPALNQPPEALGTALLIALGKGLIFIIGAVVLGIWGVPPLIKGVARTGSSELFLLTVIVLCLGVALITAAFGLSIEMGAFAAGLMLAEIEYADQALSKVLPLRDTFATLFFVSIGMLIDPVLLWANLGVILGLVLMVMVGKALIILPIVLSFRYSFKTALTAALGLNQIGEFSFILAQVGVGLGFLTPEKYVLVLGTTAVSLVFTPLSLRFAPRLGTWLLALPLLAPYQASLKGARELSLPERIQDHVVIAGYGRVGQTLVKLLQSRGQKVLVIDNSEAQIQLLRTEKIPYVLGDAESELVLERVHLERAKALAIALPDPASTRLVLKKALEFAPELSIVARAHSSDELEILVQLGAQEAVQPEIEAALEMGAHLLGNLGEDQKAINEALQTVRAGRYRSLLPEPLQNVDLENLVTVAQQELNGVWVDLTARCPLVGLTLAEADIRNLTGATVMAVARGGQTLRYPTGQTRLAALDRILVVGSPEELKAFRDLTTSQAAVQQGMNDWVTLGPSSPWVGQNLMQLDLRRRYDVVVQAIRRQGKLYNAPGGDMTLEEGDCLLLRGEVPQIALMGTLAQS